MTSQLPAGSAIARSYTGGVEWGWREELLATAVELQHATVRVLLGAYSAKRAKLPPALEIPRPYTAVVAEIAEQEKPKRPKPKKRNATMKEALGIVGAALGGRTISDG